MNTFFEEKSSQNVCRFKKNRYLCIAFERDANMVAVVQLVRASDCGSECRGFESHLPPKINPARFISCRVSCYISVLSGILFLSYKRITIVLLKVYYRLKTYKKAC